MIKVYKNGDSFILENKEFLDQNKYMSSLIYVDANALKVVDKKNYVILSKIDDKKLIAIKVEPFNLLLYGHRECLGELLDYIKKNEYELNGIMCPTILGDNLTKMYAYKLSIGLDFMEAKEKTIESSSLVMKANMDDLDEIYNMSFCFYKDCGLPDIPNKEKIQSKIDHYRIIKVNDVIVAMAAYSKDTENSEKIMNVYTKDEYRGKGYAKAIVNNLKNEILDKGLIATLNVDQANPISNHIYQSIGFKKVFSQGIYEIKEK